MTKKPKKTEHEKLREFREKSHEDRVQRNLSNAQKSETPSGTFNFETGTFE